MPIAARRRVKEEASWREKARGREAVNGVEKEKGKGEKEKAGGGVKKDKAGGKETKIER